MATEADISDHISPMKIDLEDKERSTGNSKIDSEEFIGVEEKVESGFTQPTLEARENMQVEKGTRAAGFHVVNEGIVKAMEGDNLQSPSVADEELDQLNFTGKLSGAQKGDKNETETDENIILASNLDQNANRVTEPKGTLSEEDSAQMNFNSGDESQNKSSESLLTENERMHKVKNFEISKKESDLVGKDIVEDNLKKQPEARKHEEVDNIITKERDLKETPEHEESSESSMNNNELATQNVEMLVTKTSEGIKTTPLSETPNQIPARETGTTISNDVKELATPEEKSFQEFEESIIPNKGQRIDEDVNNEIDLSNDSNSERMPNYTQESEVIAKMGEEEVSILGKKRQEPEESSPQKAQENKIRNDTAKSEDLSSFTSEAPREEIYEKKMEGSQANETLTKIVEKEELGEPSPKRAEENPIGNEKLEDVSSFVSQAPTEELYEVMMGDTQENKISIKTGKEKELGESSLLKSEENKIGDYIEKSEDVSSSKSQAPREEFREEKIEDTKKCAENFDIAPGVTEATSSTEIKLIDKPLEEAPIMESQLLPEHAIEKEDLEKSKKLDAESGVDKKVHDVCETTTSPAVERSGATEVGKIIREVPNQQVLPLEQGAEADCNAETGPCQATQAEETKEQFPASSFVLLSGGQNGQNESKAAIEDKTGLEGSDVADETNEIDETLTSANAEENEVSDNNGAETSESVTKSSYHCAEDEIVDKTVTEFIKQDADGLPEEKFSELTDEIKVQRVKETDNTKAQLPRVDIQAGKEDEESKDVPKTTTESRYQGSKSAIEGNTSPDDAEIGKTRNQTEGSSEADQPEELRREDPEALSEPTDQVVEEVSNYDIVAPKEATEDKTLNEIQLNDDEPVNFTNSSSTAESIETTENADMNQQDEGIEKVNLDNAIIDLSSRMHEDEQRDSGRDKIDNEVEEATTPDYKDQVVEDTIHEEKEITAAVPASIFEIDSQGVGAIIVQDISPEPCSILINDQPHEATTEMDMINAESIHKNDSLFKKETPATTGTVDSYKQDPEVDDIKVKETFTMESQLLGHDNETEASESITEEKTDAESESLGHNVENITETYSSPAMRDTQTSGIEPVLREVPEDIHQASEDGGKSHIETMEKSDVDVVKAEEATWFDAESKDIVEDIYEAKAIPSTEISTPDGRKEERDGLAERMSAVDDETDERPLATGESEEYLESSSALLSVLKYGTEESEVSEIETDSDVLSFEEIHRTEATPAVEKTQASKVEQETKESPETISEPKCHDVGTTIDQEILSNHIFPLENVEVLNTGVEETDIAPTKVSEVANPGEVNHSYKAIEDFDIRSDCKTPETTKTVDTYQQDPELESINPEEASIVESKLEEHESIEAQKSLAEAKTKVGDVEVETPKVLGVESESSSIEEIHEENAIPLVGETGFGASDSIDGISPTRMNHEENFEGDVLNLSSHENEESSTKITESDSLELNETSGMLSQLQNTETRLTSDADEDKDEEVKGCDDICESKDGQEEINGTRTSLIAEVPCKVKMEEETNRLDDKISDTESIQEDVPAAESTSVSKCPTENPDMGEETEHPTDDEPGVAIISESLSKSRVLGVENIGDTEASPSVGETHPDREDGKKPKIQAVDGVHGTTVPAAREDDINETYQENREAPETITKVINQDAGAVSTKELTLTQPIEKGEMEKQEEESFDAVPESKDQNFEEDYDTKSISAAEIHETDTTKEDGTEVLEKMSGGTYTGFEAIVDGQTQATITTDRETVFELINQGVGDFIQNEINMQPNEPLPDWLEDKKQESIHEDGIIKPEGTSNNNSLLNENAVDSLEARRTDEESSATPVDEKCKEDFHLEVEKIGKALQPESEIHDSKLEYIPEVTANVDEQLKEAVVNLGEGGSENRDENTTEAAQATHEMSSGETLAEEHNKAEANPYREAIISDYHNVESPEQVSVETGTTNVNAAEEEISMGYVEKEPITENAGKEGDNLVAEETRSIKEVKIPEVTLGNHENTLGHYNDKDEIAIAKVSNFENQVEKEKMEDEFSLPACEEKGNEGSVGIEEQDSITNATDFSSKRTTSGEELADKRETKVDEKQLDFTQDPASVISSVEQVENPLVIPEANNQKAIGDVTETKELMKEPQEQEKISPSLSVEQIARNKDLNEQKENKKAIANRDFQATSEDSVVAKQVDSKEEKVREESPETKNKLTPNDPAEVLSSEILDKPRDQMIQVAEESKTETEERSLVEEEKTNEEEEDENKKASVIPSVKEQFKMPSVTPEANNPKATGDVTETKDIMKEPQEQEKISPSLSDAQIARKEDLNEEKENIEAIASRDFQATSGDPTVAKQVDPKKDKVGDKSPETTKELTPNNQAEVLSSELLDKPIDQINQVGEELKTEVEERSPVEEEKTDEEEGDENKKADSGSDAPVMVEASKDTEVKTPRKKSHNIFSGVGSKMKHSIAKVKKAVAGKSSHEKASSPKEDKKKEAASLL